ncbi:MAG: hypothetical protein GKR98_16675 [Boseongicola sp.]|nr:MAG: hypothetical protein GKR98_00115 [Boseongicola sp.]QMU59670.1 MAG: hypothetical protein GKR98_16675 [Boseongicola sp.]
MAFTLLHKKLDQKVRAVGPVYVGQVLAPVVEDERGGRHSIVFLPDKNNPELRAAGRPMHFYFLPSRPRLAREGDGHFIFHLQKFSGIMDPSMNIGESGFSELAGGALSFTATLAPPDGVVDKAFEALKEMLPAQSIDHYMWRPGGGARPPVLVGPVPLKANNTVLHSISFENSPESPEGTSSDNPDAWAFEVQGAGSGALNVLGANAFTTMMGRRPATLLWASAQSGTSQIAMENSIHYDVWQLVTKIKIEGDWEKVRDHFSAGAEGGVSWFRFDTQREVNSLIESGAVTVKIDFGAGMTNAERKADIEKAADAVADKIYALVEAKLKEAGSSIEAESAKAPDVAGKMVRAFRKNFWVGLSVGINSRKDIFEGTFTYEKEINEQVTRSEMLSSQMEGLFDETSSNQDAFDRYFSEVFMEEAFTKIHVIATANANWQADDGTGDPINQLKVQVGYPNSQGSLDWHPTARAKDDLNDDTWSDMAEGAIWNKAAKDKIYAFDFTRHDQSDDEAETIHVRKTIQFKESPDIATNEVTEEYTTDDHMIEVRAKSSGELIISPIKIDMPIGSEDKQVSVLIRVRTPRFGEKTYTITGETERDMRQYRVWYASPDEIESYEYKTEVTVKGRRFGQRPLRWEGDWQASSGASGELLAKIPEVPEDLVEKLDAYLAPA